MAITLYKNGVAISSTNDTGGGYRPYAERAAEAEAFNDEWNKRLEKFQQEAAAKRRNLLQGALVGADYINRNGDDPAIRNAQNVNRNAEVFGAMPWLDETSRAGVGRMDSYVQSQGGAAVHNAMRRATNEQLAAQIAEAQRQLEEEQNQYDMFVSEMPNGNRMSDWRRSLEPYLDVPRDGVAGAAQDRIRQLENHLSRLTYYQQNNPVWDEQERRSGLTTEELRTEQAALQDEMEAAQEEYTALISGIDPALGLSTEEYLASPQGARANGLLSRIHEIESELDTYSRDIYYSEGSDRYAAIAAEMQGNGGIPTTAAANTAETNEVYRYINDIGGARDALLEADSTFYQHPYRKYEQMTDEEIGMYNYIYASEGADAAGEYLRYLESTLNARQMAGIEAEAHGWANEMPLLADIAAVPLRLTSGAGIIGAAAQNAYRSITGDPRGVDYNSPWNTSYARANAIGEQRTENIASGDQRFLGIFKGDLAAQAYNLGGSMVDSAVVAAITIMTGFPAAILLSGNAATSAMMEAKERGVTDEQALITGFASGAAEYVFERVSLDKLEDLIHMNKRNLTDWVLGMLRQGFYEGSEEVATSLANTIADAIINSDLSQLNVKKSYYIQQGMSAAEAEALVRSDWIQSLATDFIGGMASGLLMGGAFSGVTELANRGAYREAGGTIRDLGIGQAVVDDALTVDPRNTTAQIVQQRMGAGKNVSDAALGKVLYQTQEARAEQQRSGGEESAAAAPKTAQRAPVTAEKDEGITGLKYDNGTVTVQMRSEDGGTRSVAVDEYTAPNDGLQNLIERAAELGEAAPVVYAAYSQGQDVASYVNAAGFVVEIARGSVGVDGEKALNYLKNESTIASGLSEGQIDALYTEGRALGMANPQIVKRGSGTVRYEAETPRESLKGRNADALAVIEALAKITGLDFVIYESKADAKGNYKGEQGSYSASRGEIRIDLRAGINNKADIGKEAMLRTTAHELTHFLRDTAPEQYAKLQGFMIDHLSAWKGMSLDDLVQSKIARSKGQSLSYARALEEVVADGCEMMLKDTKAIRQLEKTDKGLYNRIKKWVRQFLDNLRSAFEGVEAAHPEARHLMNNYANEMQALWDAAFVAGVQNYRQQNTAKQTAEAQKNSAQEGVKEQAREADEHLQDAIQFRNDIAEWNSNGRPSGEMFVLGYTGDVLQGLGAVESDIYMLGDKIETILNDHPEITLNEIKRIPDILNDPVLILKSRNVGRGSTQNTRLVIFGSIVAKNGQPVMAVLDLRPRENGFVINDMQKVSSAYTKNNNPTDFIRSSFILHADKKRTIRLLRTVGFQMPIELSRYGSIGRISYSNQNVKLYGEKFSDVVKEIKGNTQKNSDREIFAENAKKAIAHFGTTYRWNETGYLTQSGKKLDFSGRHDGAPGGYRTVDHRDIREALGWDYGGDDYSGGMVQFMREGNIRIMPESGGINLSVAPTKAQESALADFISRERGEVILDIDDENGNTIASKEYSRGTHSSRVLSDIRAYFERGEIPSQQPSVADFHYSERDYSYDALISKPDMALTLVDDRLQYQPNSESRKNIIARASAAAKAIGTTNENGNAVIHVSDTDTDVVISNRAIRHGLDRRFSVNAPVTLKVGEILQNAIRINELVPDKANIDSAYVLIGAAKNAKNEPYIVQFVVNRATNEVASVDVLYAVNAKKEPSALLPEIAELPATLNGSTISIENLLAYVNRYFPDILPESVLRHYGYDARPEGVLGESALYSEREPLITEQTALEDQLAAKDESTLLQTDSQSTEAEKDAAQHAQRLTGMVSDLEREIATARRLQQEAEKMADIDAEISALTKLQDVIMSRVKAITSEEDFTIIPSLTKEYNDAQQRIDSLIVEASFGMEMGDQSGNTIKDPMEGRDLSNVGNRSVMAFSEENPIVRPFFRAEARAMLDELNNSTAGERFYTEDGGYTGTSRHTSESIAYLLDSGMKRAEIEQGLNAIIDRTEQVNNAPSKRVEIVLHDRLMNGYTEFETGDAVYRNEAYIEAINEMQNAESDLLNPDARTEQAAVKKLQAATNRISALEAQIDEIRKQNDKDMKRLVFEKHTELINAMENAKAAYEATMRDTVLAESMNNARRLAKQRRTQINKLENQLAALKQRKQEAVKAVREEKNKRLQELRAESRRRLADYRASRNERDDVVRYRKRIEKKVKDLSDLLLTNSDKKHVPEALKEPLAAFLMTMDTTSDKYRKSGEQTRRDVVFANRMADLVTALERARNSTGGEGYLDLPDEFMDAFEEFNKTVRTITEQQTDVDMSTPLYTMNGAQLKDLDFLLGVLKKSVDGINKLHVMARYQTVADAAESTIKALADIVEYQPKGKIAQGLRNKFGWDNATPVYAFGRFGEAGEALFKAMWDGQSDFAFITNEVLEYRKRTVSDKQVRQWSQEVHTIDLSGGRKIRMTTAQLMSFYALTRREQAMEHLRVGGIRIATITGKRNIQQAETINLAAEDFESILRALPKEARAVAEQIQTYMTERGSQLGNAISMKRFGYRSFTEPVYFPIRTVDSQTGADIKSTKENDLNRLLNMSFTKSTVPNAHTSVVVDNMFDVFSAHMSDMAKYHAFALPVLDMVKWYGYDAREALEDGSEAHRAVKTAIEQAYGERALNYISTFLKDVNGADEGGRVRGANVYQKLMSRYKAASVGANIRVAIQQPTSYWRASAVLDPKYLAVGEKVMFHNAKPVYEEMTKYAGIAVWKSMGFRDFNVGRSVREQIAGTVDAGEQRLDKVMDLSMKLAELGDSWTWCRIWEACKAEVKATKKLSGEALLKATAERFNEVIAKTQVVDSVLTRSHTMRSKSTLDQIMTPFMAEPTLSYNIVQDAAFKLGTDARRTNRQDAWKKNSKALGRAFGVFILSAFYTAVFQSLADALRDDDDYVTVGEKFLDALVPHGLPEGSFMEDPKGWIEEAFDQGNILDSLNILNNVPGVHRTVFNVLKGFDDNAMWTTSIYNAYKASLALVEMIGLENGTISKATDLTWNGNMTWFGVVQKNLQALSQIVGIPVYNFVRDGVSIYNTVVAEILGRPEIKLRSYDPGAEKRITYAYNDGTISFDKAVSELMGIGFSENDAYIAVMKAGENGQYGDLLDAVFTGGDVEHEMERLTSHGVKVDGIYTKIRSAIKAALQQKPDDEGNPYEGYTVTEEEAAELLAKYGDRSQEDAEEMVLEWSMYGDTGMDYNEIKDLYLSGELDEADAQALLETYGGLDADDAYWKVQGFGEDSTSEYLHLSEALQSGSGVQAAIDELLEHGKTQEQVEGQVRSYAKLWFQQLDTEDGAYEGHAITKAEAKRMMTEYGGKTSDEADAAITNWTCEVETGIAYGDMKDAFMSGEISRSKAVDYRVKYGGATREQAEATVNAWQFEKDTGIADATAAEAEGYYEYAKPNGISASVYHSFYEQAKGLSADVDANGNSISGSKRKKVLALINSLPLTSAQKDALYYAEGYAASKLWDTPWH